jgi:SAM-dependent methyltransferase
MGDQHQSESDQAKLWNGPGGQAWVELQGVLDQCLKPFEELLAQVVPTGFEDHVLDVGCGAGATTFAVARRLGPHGRATGVDISAPLISAAQARAEREGLPASFIRADAQRHGFTAADFSLIVSRFGVMFFDDSVQAFSNLRRAAREDASLQLLVWRGAAENPFMTTAERAAAPLLPNLPPRRPGAPGQFAFADEPRVTSILQESGWRDVALRPVDVTCGFGEQDLIRYFTRLGPVGQAFREADDALRAKIIAAVRPAFDPFVHGGDVRFDAACWMISARAA